eukprot:10499243-Heterocapsa_arctica.AAC.1
MAFGISSEHYPFVLQPSGGNLPSTEARSTSRWWGGRAAGLIQSSTRRTMRPTPTTPTASASGRTSSTRRTRTTPSAT